MLFIHYRRTNSTDYCYQHGFKRDSYTVYDMTTSTKCPEELNFDTWFNAKVSVSENRIVTFFVNDQFVANTTNMTAPHFVGGGFIMENFVDKGMFYGHPVYKYEPGLIVVGKFKNFKVATGSEDSFGKRL